MKLEDKIFMTEEEKEFLEAYRKLSEKDKKEVLKKIEKMAKDRIRKAMQKS